MKRFLKKFEDTFAAAAFAEAGEFETAKEIIREKQSLANELQYLRYGAVSTINSLASMAMVFAKAGDKEAAVELLQEAETMLQEIRENYQKKFLDPAKSSA